MSRDKQIEEMAKAIHINCHKGLTEDEAKMIAKWCYQEVDRKVSDAASDIIDDLETFASNHIKAIGLLKPQNQFCSGGKQAFDMVIKFLVEIRKKYTGERV